jgi:hypothetical protein
MAPDHSCIVAEAATRPALLLPVADGPEREPKLSDLSRRRDCSFVRLSGKAVAGCDRCAVAPQAVSDRAAGYQVAGAIEWLCSLSRLWEAAISRHSDLTAALPLRWKRSIRRLALICPNTGSMLCLRLA